MLLFAYKLIISTPDFQNFDFFYQVIILLIVETIIYTYELDFSKKNSFINPLISTILCFPTQLSLFYRQEKHYYHANLDLCSSYKSYVIKSTS